MIDKLLQVFSTTLNGRKSNFCKLSLILCLLRTYLREDHQELCEQYECSKNEKKIPNVLTLNERYFAALNHAINIPTILLMNLFRVAPSFMSPSCLKLCGAIIMYIFVP